MFDVLEKGLYIEPTYIINSICAETDALKKMRNCKPFFSRFSKSTYFKRKKKSKARKVHETKGLQRQGDDHHDEAKLENDRLLYSCKQ